MTNLDLHLFGIAIVTVYVAIGVFIGKAMDYEGCKKNWIISFFDGYLIVIPAMIMMTGLGLFIPLYGCAMLIYSFIKFIMGEFVLNDYTGAGIIFGLFTCISCFWLWFRSKVLEQEDIF